ncbi:MAG: hypothetical protein GC160_17995 [Acidobacteria bacterium]|nr:hypothetical protein [Acidobacteriota bacterium]
MLRSLLAFLLLAAAAAAQSVTGVTMVGTEERQDDLPAIATAPDGSLWLAFLSYSERRDQIGIRQYKDGVWGSLTFVPNTSGDSWLPQIGIDGSGGVWIVWSQGLDENWDLYARRFDPKEQTWGRLERLTDHPLPDVNPRLASDGKGRLAVVWQGWRGRFANIFLKTLDNGLWQETLQVSAHPANEWEPAAAFDSAGTVWVAWDSYRNGNYDIYLAGAKDGAVTVPEMAVAATALYEVKPTLAVDGDDRVWVAYEEGGANWGKDTGYTIHKTEPGVVIGGDRSVRVMTFANGKIQAPADSLQRVMSPAGGTPDWTYQPHLFRDGKGSVWAVAKRRINLRQGNGNRGYWEYYLSQYAGDRWTDAVAIPHSKGRSSTRIQATVDRNGDLNLAWPTDNRTEKYYHRPIRGEVYVGKVAAAAAAPMKLISPTPLDVQVKSGHANEAADLDAIRGYRAAVHGRPVQIVRGDFHRHTELSWDGGGGSDGSLPDFYRYMIDAAAMDFGASTDHQGGAWEYWWFYTQKMTDMYHVPGAYTPIYGFERSATQPNGHRNVFYAERSGEVVPFFQRTDAKQYDLGTNPVGDLPPVGSGTLVEDDTKRLYDEIRRMNGIAIPHTSGTRMGTDWRDNDPELEPVVEIFQGARTNYEYVGAPLSAVTGVDDDHVKRAGYHPEGFVRLAWNKGYRLGTIASSDHGSTHYSYAMVYTDRPTRQGILDAIRRRHTYGATDNIVLDVRMGDSYFMGDEVRSAEPLPIHVKVRGTNAVDKVLVIRGDQVLYTHTPNAQEATFDYVDESARNEKGTFYYYVRVEQKDGQIAWASPFWVTY